MCVYVCVCVHVCVCVSVCVSVCVCMFTWWILAVFDLIHNILVVTILLLLCFPVHCQCSSSVHQLYNYTK